MFISVDRGKIIQISTAAAANLLSALFGFTLSWTSPAISILKSVDTPLSTGPLSADEISLMTALMYVGCILGSILAGWLVNSVGRRTTMMILVIPQFVGLILIGVIRNVTCLYAFRILSGITGAGISIAPIFVSEISDKSLREANGNFMGLTYNIGCFFGKFLTSFFGFYGAPVAIFITVLLFCLIFWKLPDTPQYYLLKDRPEEAEKSLKFYRGIPESHSMTPKVAEEFSELKNSPSLTNQNVSLTIKDFKGASTILAIVITLFVNCNPNFTGLRLIIGFAETLLHDSGSTMDTASVDTVMTAIQLVVGIFTIPIVQFFSNRKILMAGYVICFASQAIAGAHYYLNENGADMRSYWWIISISLTVSLSVSGNALLSMAYAIPAEILSAKIRGFIASIFAILSWIIAFLLTQFYLPLVHFWGHSVWMWLFSAFCFSGIIFTYFFIPETKGKSFDEIVELIKDKTKLNWKKTLYISKK